MNKHEQETAMKTPWERIDDDNYKQWLAKAMTPEDFNDSSIGDRRGLLTDCDTEQLQWQLRTANGPAFKAWLINGSVAPDEFNSLSVFDRMALRTEFDKQQLQLQLQLQQQQQQQQQQQARKLLQNHGGIDWDNKTGVVHGRTGDDDEQRAKKKLIKVAG